MKRGRVRKSSNSIRQEFERRLPELVEALEVFVSRMGVKRHDIHDVVQNTCYLASRDLESLRQRSKLLPWMKAIARNQANRLFSARRMNAMPDGVREQRKPDAVAGVSDDLDVIVPALAAISAQQQHKVLFALHLLGWSLQGIAAYSSEKVNSIRSVLSRMKKKIQTGAGAAARDESAELELTLAILNDLFASAVRPIKGAGWYNQPLGYEVHQRFKALSDLHPRHAGAAVRACMSGFSLGQLAEYAEDDFFVSAIETWRRHAWDRDLIDTGVFYHERALQCDPPELLRLEAEYYHLVFSPMSHEEVRWSQVLATLQRRILLDPKTPDYLEAARVIRLLHGPMKAAKYLESHKRNRRLTSNRAYFYYLGLCYYKAEEWGKARTMLKKSMAWEFNQEFKDMIAEAIDVCSDHLQAAKK